MLRNVDPPRLETPRLLLRGHELDDFEASAAMWSDPAVVGYISDGRPSTREQSWDRVLRYPGLWRFLGFGYWVVEDRSTGAFIGEVGFADYQREIEPPLEGRPEIGWVLKTSAHRQGFATEAARRIIDWGDTFLEALKTVCIVDPQHVASIRLAKKLGYVEISTSTYKGKPVLVMEREKRAQEN